MFAPHHDVVVGRGEGRVQPVQGWADDGPDDLLDRGVGRELDRDRQGAVDQDQPADPIGRQLGGVRRDLTTHRVTDQDRGRRLGDLEAVEDRDHVTGMRTQPERARQRSRATTSAVIDRIQRD